MEYNNYYAIFQLSPLMLNKKPQKFLFQIDGFSNNSNLTNPFLALICEIYTKEILDLKIDKELYKYLEILKDQHGFIQFNWKTNIMEPFYPYISKNDFMFFENDELARLWFQLEQ